MNLKEMEEKRNTLLTEMEALTETAETEKRSISDDESTEINTKADEIKSLDADIEKIKSERSSGEKINMEERTMEENETKELRAIEGYLRQEENEETRELTTTSQGGAVIPEHVAAQIVKKMEESSPIFAQANKLTSVSGTLKIAKENDTSVAGFVGEGEDAFKGQLSFDDVKLNQKRVTAAVSLSNQLINDSAVDLVGYAVNLLSRRASKAVEKSALVGEGGDEFRGIVRDEEIGRVEAEGAIGVDKLMDLYNSVHPEFLSGAAFYMSRKFFNKVSKLKDNNGHFYMQNGVVNGRLTYTLFGAEVSVTDALTTENPAIFGNVNQAYAMMVKQGLALQHVKGDTAQAMRGSQLLILDGYMDGAIYNPQAISKLVVADAGEETEAA